MTTLSTRALRTDFRSYCTFAATTDERGATVAHRAQEGADECTRQELFNPSQVIIAGASARPQIRQQKATNVTQFSPIESAEF
jgi:hypothetical protein